MDWIFTKCLDYIRWVLEYWKKNHSAPNDKLLLMKSFDIISTNQTFSFNSNSHINQNYNQQTFDKSQQPTQNLNASKRLK